MTNIQERATPEVAVLNIFQDNNTHLQHKELTSCLLSSSQEFPTRDERDQCLGMNMDHWYQAVRETALLEELTNKSKQARGQTKEDAFIPG